MECVPPVSADVVNDATPETIGTVARAIVPSLKVMPPASGVPAPEVTVPLKVTECPNVDGFSDDTKAVEVAA